MDKVTRQCPQTTTFLKRKESRSGIEPKSFRLPALPLGQTGSQRAGLSPTVLKQTKESGYSDMQSVYGPACGSGFEFFRAYWT